MEKDGVKEIVEGTNSGAIREKEGKMEIEKEQSKDEGGEYGKEKKRREKKRREEKRKKEKGLD